MRLQSIVPCCALLACCGGRGVWRQTAELPAGSGTGIGSVLVDETRVFVGTSAGLVVTTDDGKTWADSSTGLPMVGAQLARVDALTSSGGVLLAGTAAGVYSSADHGATWTSANTGLPNVDLHAFWTVGGATLVGLIPGGLFRTSNQGMSWSPSNTGIGQLGAASFAQLSTTIFAALEMAVARSSDDGQTWETSPSPGGSNPLVLATLDGTLYAGTQSAGIFKTLDGMAFNAVNSGLTATEPMSALLAHDSKLYLGTSTQGVFFTNTGGATWTAWSEGFTDKPRVVQFAVHGSTLFAATELNGVWMRDL